MIKCSSVCVCKLLEIVQLNHFSVNFVLFKSSSVVHKKCKHVLKFYPRVFLSALWLFWSFLCLFFTYSLFPLTLNRVFYTLDIFFSLHTLMRQYIFKLQIISLSVFCFYHLHRRFSGSIFCPQHYLKLSVISDGIFINVPFYCIC